MLLDKMATISHIFGNGPNNKGTLKDGGIPATLGINSNYLPV